MESKIDEMYLMIQQMQITINELRSGEWLKNPIKINEIENWWSIETNFNNVYVKFSKGTDFNEFKEYIKQLGGLWIVTKKAWKFPNISTEQIIISINEKYPNKEFKDLR